VITGEQLQQERVKNLNDVGRQDRRPEATAIAHFTHAAKRRVKDHRK
jgi:hypothetical protein